MNLNEKQRFGLISWLLNAEIAELRYHEEIDPSRCQSERARIIQCQYNRLMINIRAKECERLLKALDDEGNINV